MEESKVLEQLFPSNHWQYRFEWIDLELSKLSLFFNSIEWILCESQMSARSKVSRSRLCFDKYWKNILCQKAWFIADGIVDVILHNLAMRRCFNHFGPIVYNGKLKSQNQDQNSNLWYRISPRCTFAHTKCQMCLYFFQVFWPTGKTFAGLCVPCYYLVNGRRGASNPA